MREMVAADLAWVLSVFFLGQIETKVYRQICQCIKWRKGLKTIHRHLDR